MSFSLAQFIGDAEKVVEHDFTASLAATQLSEREHMVVEAISNAAKEIAAAFGGHISITAYGHASPLPSPGDTAVLNVNLIPKPTPASTATTSPPPADPTVASEAAPAGEVAASPPPLEAASISNPASTTGLTQPAPEVPVPEVPVPEPAPVEPAPVAEVPAPDAPAPVPPPPVDAPLALSVDPTNPSQAAPEVAPQGTPEAPAPAVPAAPADPWSTTPTPPETSSGE